MRTWHAAAAALLALAFFVPQHAICASELQWTAVTLARDGVVGHAVHGSRAHAVALAIADCRRMRRWSDDCGSLLVALRHGWVIAMVCGGYGILVAERTLATAEARAASRRTGLGTEFAEGVPECMVAAIIGGGISQ